MNATSRKLEIVERRMERCNFLMVFTSAKFLGMMSLCGYIRAMNRWIIAVLGIVFLVASGNEGIMAQCPTTNIAGNLVPSNGDTLSGTYLVSGNFIVPPGVSVHVRPFRSGGCGQLQVIALGNIQIDGTINGTGAGYSGGLGGALGTANNISFIESCPAPTDQCGAIVTIGGGGGASGNPGGGGFGGSVGLDGGGRKNQCFNFNDDGGRVGGSGGAGGGAGGSYGGVGTTGAPGGAGSLPVVNSAISTCTTNVITAGLGGNGGSLGAAYGTLNGLDIDLGSAGGGAGGGGRGRTAGTSGGQGGSGGGLIYLESGGDFSFTGTITSNGTNGGNGGNGGSAGPSPRCCSDACDGVDEYTHTGAGGAGAGGGGGSGGGVLFKINGIATITGSIASNGGNGGAGGGGGAAGPNLSLGGGLFCSTTTATTAGGGSANAGGAGAGGRVKIFYNDCAPGNLVAPATSQTGGSGNGGNAANGTYYSGTDGSFAVGTMSPATQTVCYLGDPGNLNSLPASGGYGGITYQWQASAGCTGNFTNIPGATSLNYDPPAGLTSTTCYRLQILSGTCVAYPDTLQVNVIPPQFASITPSGNVAACVGDSVLLETSGGAGATYQWLLNGMPIPAATDSFFVANTSGAYSVQINYPVGCAGLSAQTNIQFDLPPSAFVFNAGDSILCPGEQALLNGFGQGTYQWQLNGTAIPGATNNTVLASQPGDYQLVVTSPGGCATLSDSLTLTAGVAATAILQPSGPSVFCAADSVVLNASGGSVVQWLLNGLSFPVGNPTALTVFSSGQYSVVVASPTGCLDTATVLNVLSDTVVATLSAAVSPIACTGDSALYLATGGGSYQWLFNQQPTNDTANFLFAGVPGDYTVVVTSVNGCVDTSITLAFSYFPPVFPIATALESPFLCANDSVTLRGFAAGGISYQWLLNDTAVPGATSLLWEATSPGTYTFQAFDQYGCAYVSPYLTLFPGGAPVAEITPLGNLPVCRYDSITLFGSGGDTLSWYVDGILIQSGTDSLFTLSIDGEVVLVVETGCGQDSSMILEVQSGAGPTAGFYGNNHPDSEVEFVDQSISGATWLWDFGDGLPGSTDQDPIHVFPGPGTYPITMITWDIFGCSDTISQLFEVVDPVVFIPNVFSPNGDGVNDEAVTNFSQLSDILFRIYDRWGRVVFVTNAKDEYWDGFRGNKVLPDGVYFYHLTAKDARGNDVQVKGNITLMR